jgi:hypothetical protein
VCQTYSTAVHFSYSMQLSTTRDTCEATVIYGIRRFITAFTENTAVGDPPRQLRNTPLSAKVGTYFADKRRSVGIVRSLTQATEFVLCLSLVPRQSRLIASVFYVKQIQASAMHCRDGKDRQIRLNASAFYVKSIKALAMHCRDGKDR